MPPGELRKAQVDRSKFNRQLSLPYELRAVDFEMAMQDVYDFFHDVNTHLRSRGLQRCPLCAARTVGSEHRPEPPAGALRPPLTSSGRGHVRCPAASIADLRSSWQTDTTENAPDLFHTEGLVPRSDVS